ncbi:MAG: hypothetical protein ACT4PU_05115 [Planctomycetota bacterium]
MLRLYARDDSGGGRHLCLRLDTEGSAQARQGVEAVEALARAAADVNARHQRQQSLSLADLAEQEQASAAFTQAAADLYRRLLGAVPRS